MRQPEKALLDHGKRIQVLAVQLLGLAVVVTGLMLFYRLGALPLRDPDEGRNAAIAREMNNSKAWLIPTYDGLVTLDKPSFFLKSIALSFALFGESEASARLPSALSAAAILVMVYFFCRREYPDGLVAPLAVLAIATSPLFFVQARHVIFDMQLAFFVCAAIFSAYHAEAHAGSVRARWHLLAAVAAGLATLVKGPVGFLVPLLVMSAFFAMRGEPGCWKRAFAPANIAVFLLVVLPWFFGVTHYRPDFPYYGLVEESFHRFTTTSFQRTGPIYYYGIVVAAGFFAWNCVLPETMVAAMRARAHWSRADTLLIVWALVVVAFFSISKSKLPAYILSASAPLGILLARVLDRTARHPGGRAARVVRRALLVLAAAAGLAALGLAFILFAPQDGTGQWQPQSSELRRLGPLLLPAFEIAVLLSVCAVIAGWRKNPGWGLASFLILPMGVLTLGFGGLIDYAQSSSAKPLAEKITQTAPAARVVFLQSFSVGLPFYLGRTMTLFSNDGAELTSNYITFCLRKGALDHDVIVPVAQAESWMQGSSEPVLLIANRGSRGSLEELAQKRGVAVSELSPGWFAASFPIPPK